MANMMLVARILIVSQMLYSVAAVTKLWAVYQEDSFVISKTEPQDYVAVATFNNSINETGWATLDLSSSSGPGNKYSDYQQAYAGGFLEGYITRSLIRMHWTNSFAGFCPSPMSSKCQALKSFLEKNLKWVLNQASDQAVKNTYWYHVQLFMYQIAGLQDGAVDASGKLNLDIDVFGTYLFQVGGDLEDLNSLFPGIRKSKAADEKSGFGTGHCSALIRLLKDKSDLYVSQDTWNELSSMLRILKKYTFKFSVLPNYEESIPGRTMTFSSYPGVLMSGDDFYTISSGLLSQETTIGNSNPDLNRYIVPECVLEGIRSMVANRLASTGREWSELFSVYNSGTYNNQWMIIDYKRFLAGSDTPIPGLFYLLEQIPHYIQYDDLTDLLYKQSYFGSYNIAYFPDIYNLSGMPNMVKKYGDWFTYDKTPRALIFKRNVTNVVDLDSMTKLMRYNNFKKDPLSRCNCTPPYSAENAIACRDDLNPINGTYAFSTLGHRPHIATDMKLTSSSMFRSLSFLAISSPTYDDLPPFQWSKSDYKDKLSHVGHPDLWKFPVILFNGSYSTN